MYESRPTERPILLIADHKWRDLPGMALLKVILEDRHRLRVLVTGYRDVRACLRYFRPGAVALTTLIGPREQTLAREARAVGAAVVVIPTEGIPGSLEAMHGMLRSPDVWKLCDLYLPWGTAMGELAVDAGYLSQDRVKVTGSARFDFYQPPLRRHLLSSEELRGRYGLRAGRPVVTWATTFVIASYTEDPKRLRFNQRDFVARGLSRIPGFADLPLLAEQQKRAQDLVLEWMHQLCLAYPDAEFIIKPHPYESSLPYERLFDACRLEGIVNLHLVGKDYIWNLLNSAALHIHSGSTTGMEAWLMGVPTINLMPDGYVRFKEMEGGALPEVVRLDDSQEDFKPLSDRVGFYLNGGIVEGDLSERRRQFLERWFYLPDGRAGERQAVAIAELATKSQSCRDLKERLPWGGLRTTLNLVQYALNGLLKRNFDTPLSGGRGADEHVDFLGQRDKVVRQRDVTLWVEKIRRWPIAPAGR